MSSTQKPRAIVPKTFIRHKDAFDCALIVYRAEPREDGVFIEACWMNMAFVHSFSMGDFVRFTLKDPDRIMWLVCEDIDQMSESLFSRKMKKSYRKSVWTPLAGFDLQTKNSYF